MTIKYAGPKAIFSHTGIYFDTNKEDKYVYLDIAAQLVEALDHDYIDRKVYRHTLEKHLSDSEILGILKAKCNNLDALMDSADHDTEELLDEDLKRAHANRLLNETEREVLEKNITIMHDYMIQRSVNKSAYYCLMKLLADIASKDHIDEITLPMQQNYMHVLHSLQGTLIKEKRPMDTEISIYEKDKKLFVTLKVVNLIDKK
jgi:hypothetical protein